MHLARLTEAAQAVALSLAEGQAEAVHLHEHTYQLQPRAPLQRLAELCARICIPEGCCRRHWGKTAKGLHELCLTASSSVVIVLVTTARLLTHFAGLKLTHPGGG
jgi:hypothetical protein